MSALTDAELRALAKLDAALPSDHITRQGGVMLADLLRTAAPEVDDVNLGRIALELMRHFKGGRDTAVKAAEAIGIPDHATRAAALEVGIRQLACTALTLTELEWKDPL
ncbi:hypothetical protein [Actinomadura formosensis]|uniref:hypothetical protein n=1 Tax=Actinomadura formosensis TaxID=60706 RepID=UPI003D90592F